MARYDFDPHVVAHDEAAGWRAYYDRDWFLMLRLMVDLCRRQFRMPLPAAIVASYYLVRAGRHWVPGRAERERTQYFLTRFYNQARVHSGISLNPARAGALELGYWDVARRYKQGASREEYLRRMTELHSEIFDISPQAAAESAELRVQANELVDDITQGRTSDPERTWRELEERLRQCYRSVVRAMQGESAQSPAPGDVASTGAESGSR